MLRIYGASDDLVEIEGDVSEELGARDRQRTITIGDDKGGLRVIAKYAPGSRAVWRLSVEPIDEEVPIPWPVHVELAEPGYSCAVVVDCPPGTPVAFGATKRKAA